MDISNILPNLSMTENVVLEAYSLNLSLENLFSQIRSGISEPMDSTLLPEHLITYRYELNYVYKTNKTINNALSKKHFESFMNELKKEDFPEFEKIQKNYRNYIRKLMLQAMSI